MAIDYARAGAMAGLLLSAALIVRRRAWAEVGLLAVVVGLVGLGYQNCYRRGRQDGREESQALWQRYSAARQFGELVGDDED